MNDTWNTRYIIKAILISPEFLVIVLFQLIRLCNFEFFSEIGLFLFSDNEIVKYLSIGLPCVLLLVSVREQKEILHPYENNKILYDWKDYKKVKINTFIALMWNALLIIPTFFCWIRQDYYDEYDVGFYYCMLIIPSMISSFSMHLASQNEKEVYEKNT